MQAFCPPVQVIAHPLPRLPQPGRRNNAVTYISQHLLGLLICTGTWFSPSLPLPSTLSRLSSPPLPSIRNSFRRPFPLPPPVPIQPEPLSLQSRGWRAPLECTSVKFSRPIPACNAEEAIQSARHTSSSIPFKAPLFARHLLQSPASLPHWPLIFFLPHPLPPALPGKRACRWIRTQPQPSGPPKLARFLPAPSSLVHTPHRASSPPWMFPQPKRKPRATVRLRRPYCASFLPQALTFESRGGQGRPGAKEQAIVDLLYLPANPSPIAKINPSLCEPERSLPPRWSSALQRLTRRRGLRGGSGIEPFSLGELGAPRPPDHGEVLRGKQALAARSSWRCEKETKMPKLAPFILQATFLTWPTISICI